MTRLPRLLRRVSRWWRTGRRTTRTAGVAIGQLAAGTALAYTSLAVADTLTDSPTIQRLIAVGIVIVSVLTPAAASQIRRRRRG